MGAIGAPVHSQIERERWNAGLSSLIKKLRATNQGSDVTAVADHIARYRRTFLGDDSMVLNLGSSITRVKTIQPAPEES